MGVVNLNIIVARLVMEVANMTNEQLAKKMVKSWGEDCHPMDPVEEITKALNEAELKAFRECGCEKCLAKLV